MVNFLVDFEDNDSTDRVARACRWVRFEIPTGRHVTVTDHDLRKELATSYGACMRFKSKRHLTAGGVDFREGLTLCERR